MGGMDGMGGMGGKSTLAKNTLCARQSVKESKHPTSRPHTTHTRQRAGRE